MIINIRKENWITEGSNECKGWKIKVTLLVQLVALQYASVCKQRYPMASETILLIYMDDSMDSVQSDAQGIQLYQQLFKLMWGNTLKWLSNPEVVLNQISPSDGIHKVNLDSDPLPSAKTLGIMWHASEDVSFVSNIGEQECEWTKQ